jgi:hypothetical protein
MILRPGLRWALGATGVASIVSLWWGEPAAAPGVGQVPSQSPGLQDSAYLGPRVAAGADAALPPLPAALTRPLPEPSDRDVFNLVAPPPKPFIAPPPAPPPVAQVMPAPAPPPPPPMTWRYLGGVRAPDGTAMVYLGQGDDVVLAQPGADLPGGWRIEDVVRAPAAGSPGASADNGLAVTEIHLVFPSYPPSGHRETLRVPMPASP